MGVQVLVLGELTATGVTLGNALPLTSGGKLLGLLSGMPDIARQNPRRMAHLAHQPPPAHATYRPPDNPRAHCPAWQ